MVDSYDLLIENEVQENTNINDVNVMVANDCNLDVTIVNLEDLVNL